MCESGVLNIELGILAVCFYDIYYLQIHYLDLRQ